MDSYVEDLMSLLDYLETTNCPKPYFCLAHSTGGQVLVRAAPALSGRVERAVTTAPFFDLAHYKMSKKLLLGIVSALTYAGFGEMYAPGADRTSTSKLPFENNLLTSDPRRYQRTANLIQAHPELETAGPTISWVYAALKSVIEVDDPAFLSRVTLPILDVVGIRRQGRIKQSGGAGG